MGMKNWIPDEQKGKYRFFHRKIFLSPRAQLSQDMQRQKGPLFGVAGSCLEQREMVGEDRNNGLGISSSF